MKICSFAGHSIIPHEEEVKIKLKKEIINLIEKESVTTFYSGGKGTFDWLCAHTVNNLRKNYPFIKTYWMLAYFPIKFDEYDTAIIKELFDGTLYPDIETVRKRFAILERNKFMVDESDFLIAYVKYGGRAEKTLKYAQKKKDIKIINIAKDR